jgi:hypothetical protein
MNWKVHIAGTAIVTFLVCSAAGAQMRGGGSSGVSMPARAVPMRVTSMARESGVSASPSKSGAQSSRQPTVIQIAPNGHVISSSSSFENSFNFDDGYGVPGLGFDYVHLAAISGNFRNNAHGFGHGSHRQRNFITPIFFGGFPYYSDSSDYQQEQQPPQIIVIQQPAPPVTAQQEAPAAQGAYDTPSPAPAPAPAPVPEVGELILVRRDGRVLFASVFSVTGTQLQYVTPEGIRHSLPLAELDTVATQDMNEARGTTLQFHN